MKSFIEEYGVVVLAVVVVAVILAVGVAFSGEAKTRLAGSAGDAKGGIIGSFFDAAEEDIPN